MSTTMNTPRKSAVSNPFQPPRSARGIGRQISNGLVIVLATLFALFAVGVLIFLIVYILRQGIPYINLAFFTQLPTPNGEPV